MQTTTGISGDWVKLVVKATNQQFDDQTIDCESQWTVKRLKEHLSEVYPCKPTLDEQKLIYSGQLLKDQVIVKDILRQYDDPQPQFHILHLVYTPKNQQNNFVTQKSQQKPCISSDGLRQRNVTNQNPEILAQTSASSVTNNATTLPSVASTTAGNCPTSGFPSAGNNIPPFGFPQQPNPYNIIAQQMAMQSWMQQAYVQYMNQYMNLVSVGVRPEAVFMQHQAQPQMPYLPQNFPFAQPLLPGSNLPSSPLPSQAATAGTAEVQNGANNNTENVAAGAAVAAAAAAAPQPPAAQNQPAQQRFRNNMQDNGEDHQDWLDTFYSMIRVVVLLTLVYFYSSALRCAIVIFIGLAIYLYHIGFFRRQALQAREANNNNVAAAVENIQQQQQQNNNVGNAAQPVAAAVNNENNVQDQQQQAAAAMREGAEVASNPVPEVPGTNGTTVIAFVRTFVVSFFVSLLPETPAL